MADLIAPSLSHDSSHLDDLLACCSMINNCSRQRLQCIAHRTLVTSRKSYPRASQSPDRTHLAVLPVPVPPWALGRAMQVGLASLFTAGAAWLLRAPLVARIIGVRAKARVRLGGLDFHPLMRTCRLRQVAVHDKDGRPLFAANEVKLALPWRKETGDNTQTLFVELTQPEVVAVFDNALCTQSNWTAWASRFRRPEGPQPPLRDDEPENEKKSSNMRIKLNVVGGLVLSLRSQVLDGGRIIDDVRLTELDEFGNDLLSPSSTVDLIERLSAKAIRNVSRYSISPEVRAGVRAHARAVLKEQTRDLRALGRLKIKKLRENIGLLDQYVLQDLPDLQSYSEAAKTMQNALRQFESMLKMIDPRDNDSDNEAADNETESETAGGLPRLGPSNNHSSSRSSSEARDEVGPHLSRSSRPDIIVPPPASPSQYRELDEEWQRGSGQNADR